MFSKACEYALRATLYLAQKSSEEEKLGIDEISQAIGSPRPFTAKVLQQLAKGGIIYSVKGPSGGFFMTKEEKQLPVWAVLEAMGEEVILQKCVLGLSGCSDKKPCPLHSQYKTIRQRLICLFEGKKISHLAAGLNHQQKGYRTNLKLG